MRRVVEFFLYYLLKFSLWFRYRVTVKGLENLNTDTLTKTGGVLFLPNHPCVLIDPAVITLAIWNKYPVRPIIVEYMYYLPIVHSIMKLLKALPMPNHDISSNSLKRTRSEKTLQLISKELKEGQNFLFYPAGRLKSTSLELLGGASGAHTILQGAPEANVVLVRTTGLWGSSFSKAYIGKTPPLFSTLWNGIKVVLKNAIFFTPKRHVTVEFVPAGADFPYRGTRLEMNKYLENWYNRPDDPTAKGLTGETLTKISYSAWKEDYLEPFEIAPKAKGEVNLKAVLPDIRQKVLAKLSELTEIPASTITPQMDLSQDLGLDSLDTAEFLVFLQEQFEVAGVPVRELTTVGQVLAIASKQIVYTEEEEEEKIIEGWKEKPHRQKAFVAFGKTLPEVFLNNCNRMGNSFACADTRAGALRYPNIKTRVILLAEYMKTLPGKNVGIMLPASVAATLCILACQLAGKVPVMVNWTVGSRHLESVVKVANLEAVLSSWSFIDRLVNVDLAPIEDLLIMLEDVRREQFGLGDKIKAFFRSKRSTSAILRTFDIDLLNENNPAVILFTSGTESMPKGVPLTHRNLLSNMQAICEAVELFTDDILFGILPPFHSFGLTITGVLPLLCNIKVAYSPDPTDGDRLAKGIDRWGITILCGAPTFLKKIFKAATPEQLKTLRLVVTGAEKAPAELFELAANKGIGDIFYEGYGVTECSPAIAANRPGIPHAGVGTPLPGVEICIVHQETHEAMSTGQQGLIITRGPNVFAGYINPDVKSPFISVQGKQWYSTGDLGFLDELGRLTISGRLKRFIKVGPEMVSLGALEDALNEIASKKGWPLAEEGPSIAVCAKEIPGEKPKIAIFTRFKTQVDEINQALKESGFSNLIRVSQVEQLEEIPLMGTGKINYRALETKYM